MRKSSKILNGLCAFMLVGIVVAAFGQMNVKANNHGDTAYTLPYNGDGGDVPTPSRKKTDDSYVYIHHNGAVGAYAAVRVDGYSGNYTGMYGQGGYVPVPLGQGYKITNYVVESFRNDYNNGYYKTIHLDLSPTTHNPTRLYGVWSPDSI